MTIAFAYLQRYAVGFVVALALHIGILAALQMTLETFDSKPSKFTIEPKPLKARLIRLAPRPVTPVVQTSGVKTETTSSEKDAEAQAERNRREQLEQLLREREERLAELRNRAFQDAIGDEMTAEMADAVQDVSQVYITGIYLSVVENWSRPPSATNDMQAQVLVELFPNGELNSVGIIESSGHSAFDRSTLNAVRRAAPFVVPEELAIFEASFRSFTLIFRPEDLLR